MDKLGRGLTTSMTIYSPKYGIVCFLDVDGVLNNYEYLIKSYEDDGINETYNLDVRSINILKRMQDDKLFDTLIVHSSWRSIASFKYLYNVLGLYGIKIDGGTRKGGLKGTSILEWLDDNKLHVYDYFILEDEYFKDDEGGAILNKKIIKTNFYKGGLTEDHIDKVKEMFKGV